MMEPLFALCGIFPFDRNKDALLPFSVPRTESYKMNSNTLLFKKPQLTALRVFPIAPHITNDRSAFKSAPVNVKLLE